ncbi:MAG TPA: hypothetical protein DDY62_01130 [Cryomorphaceae bacterium]|jgi:D-arabinose 5-phosphate isomerase GutQ|nr:hypothetical protein [Cryomorphaceae bacterium]
MAVVESEKKITTAPKTVRMGVGREAIMATKFVAKGLRYGLYLGFVGAIESPQVVCMSKDPI